jgi:hypothetical protein
LNREIARGSTTDGHKSMYGNMTDHMVNASVEYCGGRKLLIASAIVKLHPIDMVVG